MMRNVGSAELDVPAHHWRAGGETSVLPTPVGRRQVRADRFRAPRKPARASYDRRRPRPMPVMAETTTVVSGQRRESAEGTVVARHGFRGMRGFRDLASTSLIVIVF